LVFNLISILLTATNAYLIGQLNNRFSIIQTRSFLPVLFFVTLIAAWHNTHLVLFSHIALSVFLLAIFVFLRTYRNRTATEQTFLSSFLIAICSLLYAPFSIFIVVLWIGTGILNSLSVRTFLAIIIGFITPWILFSATQWYIFESFEWVNTYEKSFTLNYTFFEIPLNEQIYMGAMLILAILVFVSIVANANRESLQTRAYINLNSWILVVSFLVSLFLKDSYTVFKPITAMSLAFLLAQPLSLRKSNYYSILFIIFIVLNITLVVSNIVMFPK
jgi:hypothetical protein